MCSISICINTDISSVRKRRLNLLRVVRSHGAEERRKRTRGREESREGLEQTHRRDFASRMS